MRPSMHHRTSHPMKVYEPMFHFAPRVYKDTKLQLWDMVYNEGKTVQDAMGHVYEREDVLHGRILADRDGNSYEAWREANVKKGAWICHEFVYAGLCTLCFSLKQMLCCSGACSLRRTSRRFELKHWRCLELRTLGSKVHQVPRPSPNPNPNGPQP